MKKILLIGIIIAIMLPIYVLAQQPENDIPFTILRGNFEDHKAEEATVWILVEEKATKQEVMTLANHLWYKYVHLLAYPEYQHVFGLGIFDSKKAYEQREYLIKYGVDPPGFSNKEWWKHMLVTAFYNPKFPNLTQSPYWCAKNRGH